MAWTTPGTATAGEVLTAAFWNEQVRDNILMGNPVFTNEAARDAVITAPVEGQRVYLTAPTIPAASAQTTIAPTGVTTVYNGSVWVCVTPVGAFSATTGTTTSTSFTPTLTGGTTTSVTLVTGTTALVSFGASISNTGNNYSTMSIAVSGAGTVAANDEWSISFYGTVGQGLGRTTIITGLTAGTNTFTLQHKVTAGTGNFLLRNLSVTGIA
jgi:hypothetical protein